MITKIKDEATPDVKDTLVASIRLNKPLQLVDPNNHISQDVKEDLLLTINSIEDTSIRSGIFRSGIFRSG